MKIKRVIYWGIGAAALLGLLAYNCSIARTLHASIFLTGLAGLAATVIELVILAGLVTLLEWLKKE